MENTILNEVMNLDDLKAITPGAVFATGISNNLDWTNPAFQMAWIAKTSAVNDWAIYYGFPGTPKVLIMAHGMKLKDKEMIRKLVPCTDEVFNNYRY